MVSIWHFRMVIGSVFTALILFTVPYISLTIYKAQLIEFYIIAELIEKTICPKSTSYIPGLQR